MEIAIKRMQMVLWSHGILKHVIETSASIVEYISQSQKIPPNEVMLVFYSYLEHIMRQDRLSFNGTVISTGLDMIADYEKVAAKMKESCI
jgi:hypothetical protein